MPDVYATLADCYKYGLARGTLGGPSRSIARVSASLDIFELYGHGFVLNDRLHIRASECGLMPTPLVSGVVYFAIPLTDDTFQVALTSGGPAVNLTADGKDLIVAIGLPFEEVLDYYSRFVDEMLPAHAVPLVAPYPLVIVAMVAELAAKKLMHLAGHSSVTVNEYEENARTRLREFAKGIPLKAQEITTHTNRAVYNRRRRERLP